MAENKIKAYSLGQHGVTKLQLPRGAEVLTVDGGESGDWNPELILHTVVDISLPTEPRQFITCRNGSSICNYSERKYIGSTRIRDKIYHVFEILNPEIQRGGRK